MSEDRSTRRRPAVLALGVLVGVMTFIALHGSLRSARPAAAPVRSAPAAQIALAPAENSELRSRPALASRGDARREVQPAFELKSLRPQAGPAVPAFQLAPAEVPAVPAIAGPAVTVASWYGPGFNGRFTANGEIYDQEALTAAHPTLPFGVRVRVTNLGNGQQVIVRINDRGPFVPGRGIDLSHAAAVALNMDRQGIARVALEVLDR